MDDLKESLKKYFEDRLSGPLFGYLFFSWVGFNWRALAVLGFDKRPVVERMKFIDESPDLSWHFWLPLMLGVALASVSPYLHLGLQWVHNRALRAKDNNATKAAQRRIQSERQLVRDRVVLRNEDSLEDARQKVRESILTARKARIDSGLLKYQEMVHQLRIEHTEIEETNGRLLAARKRIQELIDRYIKEMTLAANVENADQLASRVANFTLFLEAMEGIRNDKKLWGELAEIKPGPSHFLKSQIIQAGLYDKKE